MRVGIFGGTFAPIHNGHVNAAHQFVKECKLDRLYVIPAGTPPHKKAPEMFSSQDRLEMARLAFPKDDALNEKIEVSDFEINRKEKSYTYNTLLEFSKGGDELFLLCGTDMFMSFDSWYRFKELFGMCTLCLALRNNSDTENLKAIKEKKSEFEKKYGAKILMLDMKPFEVSSTEVRDLISKGKNISNLVPAGVWEFLKNGSNRNI